MTEVVNETIVLDSAVWMEQTASVALVRSLLIHTYLQIGDNGGRKFRNRFNGLRRRQRNRLNGFLRLANVLTTQLKQGVNEKAAA